jgi:hypothetical protein
MVQFARLNENNELQEVRERFERPDDIAHKNVFWFPYVEIRPDFNSSTQVRLDTVEELANDTFTRTFPVRDKTQPELDTERDVSRDGMATKLADSENILRALMLLILDEFNAHADMLNAMREAGRLATSIGDLRTRMAAINLYPTRTETQLRTAIRNKLGL